VFSFVGAKEKRKFDTTKFYRQMVQYFNSFYPKIKESYIQSDMGTKKTPYLIPRSNMAASVIRVHENILGALVLWFVADAYHIIYVYGLDVS
jgi:hypothetical protein